MQEKEELTVDADSALLAARVQQYYLFYYGYAYPDRAAIEFLSDAPLKNILYGASAQYKGSRLW